MTDVHARFRARLAAYLLEVLPDVDAAWMGAHAADCAECAALLERMRRRVPELAAESTHVPLILLQQWLTSQSTLTALERELVERHLGSCSRCREDAAQLATAYGAKQPHVLVPHRARTPLGIGIAAAAILATVIVVNPWKRSATPVHIPPELVLPGVTGSESSAVAVTIELVEPSRAVSDDHGPSATLPGPGAALRFRLPPLFVDERQDVEVRVERSDGAVLWRSRIEASALRDTLAPAAPPEGWSAGRYQVLVVPAAGRDTAATRKFGFRLIATEPR